MFDANNDSSVTNVNLAGFRSELSLANKALRFFWGIVWVFLFRPSPRPMFAWRRMLVRIFGAKIGMGARLYPSTKIYYPPNLIMHDQAIMGPDVDCYCVGTITIGRNSMVSQYSYLCGATHDFTHPNLPLRVGEIVIGENCWVCADVFIGPGVTVGDGAVVGARSTVFRDVPAWKVVAGNPPQVVRQRVLTHDQSS